MAKNGYEVTIPDTLYYKKLFNCYFACPVNTQAGNYVTKIAEGKYEDAYAIAALPNPFVNVCGRVCGHPCETECRRGDIDKPISIRALKRFATEKHSSSLGHSPNEVKLPKTGKKVAIIGSGPSGLSAAHDLALFGHDVTVFEKSSEVGGMLYLGLPKYRLPREVIALEVDHIQKLGVKILTSTPVTKKFSLSEIKNSGYDAVFIAVGADKSRNLNIEGNDLDGVLNGVDFLLNINLGYKLDLGDKVIIVGGGNVAIDVARSVVREITDVENMSKDEMKDALKAAQGVLKRIEKVEKKQSKEELRMALDIARSAMRLGTKMGKGGMDITLICLESKAEMPAHEEEVSEALGEGVNLLSSHGPRRIVGKDGKVVGLETIKVQSVFDESGRFNPVYIEGTNKIIEADTIIMAIGQQSDLTFISPNDTIELTPRGTIKVDPETMATTAPGIYAGGDVAFGPRLIIDAVANGKRAAMEIDSFLTGKKTGQKQTCKMKQVASYDMPERYDRIKRNDPPVIPLDRRIGISEVELCYDEATAKEEGLRCLKCDIHTIFDSSKCILCGGCVDVCPQYCLKLVDIDNIKQSENVSRLVLNMYGEAIKGACVTAIIKDEKKCIRCALCAKRCPADAITMEKMVLE